MTDHGHDLIFGTFLTPQNRRPQEVVELARLTERAGLDMVTFQDHPYQPAFLDTWTLLTWVAAQTQTVRLAGNVLDLPLRPPAVLARAAASLDLLSGDRFELGLGAGGFWDAIEGMGGPRRSPGEAVAAPGEAIGIIRAVWYATERGGVFVDGEHYQIRGTNRGPRPSAGMWSARTPGTTASTVCAATNDAQPWSPPSSTHAIITVRSLIRRAWMTHRWDTRPVRRP